MKRLILLIAAVAITIVLLVALWPSAPKETLDTTTHSFEAAGFYGRGDFAGELLESDEIRTNVTDTGLSQSIKFKGAVCTRVSGLGRVFHDGVKSTEPDSFYKIYVNDLLYFTHPMELGDSSVLTSCLPLVEKDYIITGQANGVIRVDLVVFVFDFTRGAGAYEVLAYDYARLI